ncbi:DUF4240 domain-containing protein [Nonomuraea turkmeniaca]|uniref:DUF4240 domain-containing protein n=1 Tax=Nonomuraea turkmeniaca TaxID=103838 RepID=A0A5S4FEL1_9ACTN|nr:DUF4240 domain-containing protein [Nonomuraea turkmeniaca]TMR16772.1 DUF4240 domain-containing protein [Nonomuraea turkmeniaca]
MDIDEFWHLIEQSARETDGKEARLRWLEEQLAGRSAEEIIDFQAWILEARRKVDTYLMWGAAIVLSLVGGDDSFWYFQMWLVGLGRETFEKVADDPDTLADVPEAQRFLAMQRDRIPRTEDDWSEFECLSYVAPKAWRKMTGTDSDALFDALEARGYVLRALPNPTDEDWDPEDDEEAVRRVPRSHRYIRELYGRV